MRVLDRLLDLSLSRLARDERASQLLIASPYITEDGVNILVKAIKGQPSTLPLKVAVVTRFDLIDFLAGASDIEAVERLASLPEKLASRVQKMEIFDLPDLHTKIFCTEFQAMTGSANLTFRALSGRNAELCLLADKAHDEETLRRIHSAFRRLLRRADFVTPDFIQLIKAQVERNQHRKEEFEELIRNIEEAEKIYRLCALPQRDPVGQANYYGQLVAYLCWVEQGHRRKRKLNALKSRIGERNDGSQLQSQRIEARIDFLLGLKVIHHLPNDYVGLTNFGRRVAINPEDERENFLHMLVRWCEVDRHDRSLRELLRPFDGAPRVQRQLSLEEWPSAVGNSTLYQIGASTSFAENTVAARNWLISVGALERIKVSYYDHFRRGSLFPNKAGGLDRTLNKAVGIRGVSSWLRAVE